MQTLISPLVKAMFTECDVNRFINDLGSFKRQVQETYAITNDVDEVIILHDVINAIDQLMTTVTPLLRQPPAEKPTTEAPQILQAATETSSLFSKEATFP